MNRLAKMILNFTHTHTLSHDFFYFFQQEKLIFRIEILYAKYFENPLTVRPAPSSSREKN